MVNISVDQIKELREKTGAGIMDCRRALEETDGDFSKAEEILRQKGIERAEKKALEREVKSGRVFAYLHHTGTVGAMVVLATETDFVAKLDEVKALGEEITKQISAMNPETVEELLSQPYIRDASKSIDQLVKEVSGKTGEKIVVADFKRISV
jgi:elongation factor Ts